MNTDLAKHSATQLAHLIRQRVVSAVEVFEVHLRNIEALNPDLNAIVMLSPDGMERARAAENRIMSGQPPRPLEGVPFTVKDTIETAGLRTTSGSLLRAEHVPVEDAPVVARLKSAGAILLGKTNVSEMAMAYDSCNPVFGRSNNPHDGQRTPGGSSGGEAAAISATLSPVGLGSDLAGSVRIPAHFCGIVGLKPTPGRVPAAGQWPSADGPFSLGAVVGPLARRVSDLHLLFQVLTLRGTGTVPQPEDDLLSTDNRAILNGARFAWYTDDGVTPATSDTQEAVLAAVRALEGAGLVGIECVPAGVDRGPELWTQLFSRAASLCLHRMYEGNEHKAGPYVQAILRSSRANPGPTLDQFLAAWLERDRLRSRLCEWMEGIPLIVAPVSCSPAFQHDARKIDVAGHAISLFRSGGYSQTFNVLGLPAVSIPAGRSREGLPIGVQVIGRPCQEVFILAAAGIIEESLGGWMPPPALSSGGRIPL
jgi:amidase